MGTGIKRYNQAYNPSQDINVAFMAFGKWVLWCYDNAFPHRTPLPLWGNNHICPYGAITTHTQDQQKLSVKPSVHKRIGKRPRPYTDYKNELMKVFIKKI